MTGEARRRWTSEERVLSELEELSDLSMRTAAEYAVHARHAAEAEADHKRLRAKRILNARAAGEKSIAAAEVVAEADDEVSTAYLRRLTTAAVADADRETMRTFRSSLEALRTAAASARDGVVGPGMSGRR